METEKTDTGQRGNREGRIMSEKEAILVSGCLLGIPCRYDGKSKPCDEVRALESEFRLVSVCPESMGGLPIPRDPSEIVGERVLSRDGKDVTKEYRLGAEKALQMAKNHHCRAALLKEKSPSCGTGKIHNGLFDGGLVSGYGVTAELLIKNEIAVFGESQIAQLRLYLGGKN